MADSKERFLVFLLIYFVAASLGNQFCLTAANNKPPVWVADFQCNNETWNSIQPPPLLNDTSSPEQCSILVLLDLDPRLTSPDQYMQVQLFVEDVIKTCMDRGVGYVTNIMPLINTNNTNTRCCSEDNCNHMVSTMPYEDYITMYDTLDPVTNDSDDFTYYFTTEIKNAFNNDGYRCLYNNVLLVTSRLFNTTDGYQSDTRIEEDYACATTTIVIVGRDTSVISDEMANKIYDGLTTNIFIVPNYNCLYMMKDCIKPCGPRGANECMCQELEACPAPTQLTTLMKTTPTTVTTTEVTKDPTLNYWHIVYVFAMSNYTTAEDLIKLSDYIAQPLLDCVESNVPIAVRFIGKGSFDSLWMLDMTTVDDYIRALTPEEILLSQEQEDSDYVNEYATVNLMRRAAEMEIQQSHAVEQENGKPVLILLTDFASQPFLEEYKDASKLTAELLMKFNFTTYLFSEKAVAQYQNTLINFVDNANYRNSNGPPLCYSPPDSAGGSYNKETDVLIIIAITVGVILAVVVLLIILTIIYRQKALFLQKWNNNIRNHHEADVDEVIDFWELSWEQLVVKNERLGHGAYGQVYKGKLNGSSPGIAKFFRHHVKQYTDCDCAVKMLPRYANESARAEFMHEIDLMKTLGCHEHIVNMLGCITAGHKSCLVLEYCSNRDLLRYLKQKKVDLEISRSIDDQIELNKEFLNFAWQISRGMRFLGHKNIVHRDLAARNILITGLVGTKCAKISDFGLAISADPSQERVSGKGRLPIKWLAPESLQKEIFTFKTDVWSFGIVLFEMYSMGEAPFSDIEPTNLQKHLEDGNRPKKPLMAYDKISEVMDRCWEFDPDKRPPFDELLTIFSILLEQATEGYGYLTLVKTSDTYKTISELEKAIEDEPDPVVHVYEPPQKRDRSRSGRSARDKVVHKSTAFKFPLGGRKSSPVRRKRANTNQSEDIRISFSSARNSYDFDAVEDNSPRLANLDRSRSRTGVPKNKSMMNLSNFNKSMVNLAEKWENFNLFGKKKAEPEEPASRSDSRHSRSESDPS